MQLCRSFLESEGPLSTPQLAIRAMKASGLDTGDKVLAKAVTMRIVYAMRAQHKRGKIGDAGKKMGARVWKIPT